MQLSFISFENLPHDVAKMSTYFGSVTKLVLLYFDVLVIFVAIYYILVNRFCNL